MQENKTSFSQTIKSFSPTFWVANFFQIMECGAWFGIFSLLGLYLVASTDEGGLRPIYVLLEGVLFSYKGVENFYLRD